MIGKYLFKGKIRCLTGLHIGGSQDAGEIGGVDLQVVRDPVTQEPYLPGSSLKGKLRSLLELYHFAQNPGFLAWGKDANGARHHECSEESCVVCRVFGASRGRLVKILNLASQDNASGRKEVQENRPARLYVRDGCLTEDSKRRLQQLETGYFLTEVKFENTLDRITCHANPRQIERVPRDTEFEFAMVYTLWDQARRNECKEDLEAILVGLGLLEDDYLGGHGSRGYGQVEFKDLSLVYRKFGYYLGKEKEADVARGGTLVEFAAGVRNWLKSKEREG